MSKHTKGPWKHARRGHVGGVIKAGDGKAVAITAHQGGNAEFLANARLIAASPAMYEYVAKRAEAGDDEAASIMEDIHASR